MVPDADCGKNGSENVKIIIGKLIDKADPSIRPIISAFDITLTRSVNLQRLNKFTVGLLESCAEFLGITLVDKDSYKIFTKSTLATRIYLGFMALMPAKCRECGNDYVIDHEPEIAPFFNCFTCFKGSHNCDRNRVLHQTLSAINIPTGFVWLCDKCHAIVDPIEPRKRSCHASGTLSSRESQSSICTNSSDILNLVQEGALPSTQHPTPQVHPGTLTAPPPRTNICKRFLSWNCPHGISGKREIRGKCCPFTHHRVCNQFRISGSTGRRGCKKGENCTFFHPDICKVTVESGSCSKKDGKNFHPRASRKKNNSGPKNGSRNAAQKVVKQNNGNTSNPSSSDFLELRNLVTGMAAKLEMLEKKMDQGTPACQPTMQPALPTIIYPTAPIPPPMVPLGVSRIPHHPIPFSHHSYY